MEILTSQRHLNRCPEESDDEESFTKNNLSRNLLSSTVPATAMFYGNKEILDFIITQDNNITRCSPDAMRKKSTLSLPPGRG